ncbi:MAG: efflux transporter outer membrane subunit [Proteobacteria bacterium]|nr:efflux transporter outer membrane subunit [Pseudomonadota bacterium]
MRGATFKPLIAAALGSLMVAGCLPFTHSTYERPKLPTENTWDQAPAQDAAASPVAIQTTTLAPSNDHPTRWVREFHDADLSALVQQVLTVNADLAAAGIRLRQARMSARLATSQLFPTFTGSLSSSASRPLDHRADWADSSGAALGASWELDLFGRLSAVRNAAHWEAAATERDLAATRLALIGTTVNGWWQLAYANERIAIGEQSLAYARQALELVQLQYRAGAVSRLGLRDAEQNVAAQEASQAQLVQGRVEARNALAALLEQQAYRGPERTELPRDTLPEVDAGLPSSILARRPDLAAAELRLRKSLATADAMRASFYPALTLTGSVGTASTALANFVSNPSASLGALLSLPFLNVDRVRLSSGIARADYEIAVREFTQSFYDALRDTANALSARVQLAQRGKALERTYAAARDAEQLYERQYRAGAIPLRSWLDAQERRRSAENSLIENRLDRLNAQVALHQALGDETL